MIKNSVGYKFEDAHIRLGSKIHLSDFYYAEKLFVNSYYAQGFAYILFDHIKDKLESWLNKAQSSDRKNIALLGYGIYSELLLSNLLYLLQNSPKAKAYNFSTTIVEDIEGLKINDEYLIKKSENIILIIPIGTTLTTSIKIRKKLLDYGIPKIIGTPITCVVVRPRSEMNSHGKYQKNTDKDKKIINKYWEKINEEEKIIILKDKTEEKYFVSLESDWEEPHICSKCFPPDEGDWNWLTEENALFETDKVSVKPSVIFSLPQSKAIKEEDINLLQWKHIHFRQHIVRGNNHFLHYIDTNIFYEDNKEKIKDWLERKKSMFVTDKPVILLAPEHNTNVKFANDVNEILFGGTGTLIHYNPGGDYKTNFAVFYRNLLTDKKPEIILIDDAICSGNTLYLLREYIKSVGGNTDESKIKVISMIDRSTVWLDAVSDFGLHSFITINLPPIKDERFCYLCKEFDTYDDIIKKTLDISLIKLLLIKKAKIEKQEFDNKLFEKSSPDFGKNEFNDESREFPTFTEERLCKVIYEDQYDISLTSPINTISWLNELLRIPNLYDIICKKNIKTFFPESIVDLEKETSKYRSRKDISNLTVEEKTNIMVLNRLLLEELYPQATPQIYEKDKRDRQKRYLKRIEIVNKLTREFYEIVKGGDSTQIQESLKNKLKVTFSRQGNPDKDFLEAFEHLTIEEKMNYIKVLAYPHFSLYKNIKIITCKLVLNELKLLLSTIGNNLTSVKYKYFFPLIRTAGKLNLNIILRSKVLKRVSEYIESLPRLLSSEIAKIESEIKNEELGIKDKENELKKEPPLFGEGIKKQIDNIKEHIGKLVIEKNNLIEIKEKEEKKETLHRYAAAVKEVIYNYNDEAKSFRLECELNNKNVPEGRLKNLLLFENVTIFQQALITISKLFQKYEDKRSCIFEKNDISEQVSKLEDLLENDNDLKIYINTDYRFEYFRLIINAIDSGNYNPECTDPIELDVSKHSTYETFLLVLILKLYLEKQKQEESNESIQDKMNLISLIIRDITGSKGCFITVKRYSTERLKDIQIEIVGTTSRDFINKEISQETETYRHWERLFKNIPCTYKIHPKKKAEFINFCTIGITDVVEEKRQYESGIPKFKIKPYGLITLASANENAFSPQKLRMLMLLKKELLGFLKKNYENDSFVEWIEEQNRKNLLLSMGHGFERYLSNLKELFDKSNTTEDIRNHFDIYHSMLFNRICYSRIFKSLQNEGDVDTTKILGDNRFNLENFNLKYFFENEIKSIVKTIYEDTKIQQSYSIIPEITCGDWNIKFYKSILRDVVFECIVNAKNHIDNNKEMLKLTIVVKPNNDKAFLIEIEDNGTGIDESELSKLNEKGYLKPEGGLSMIAILWSKLFGEKLKFHSKENTFFKVIIPLIDI